MSQKRKIIQIAAVPGYVLGWEKDPETGSYFEDRNEVQLGSILALCDDGTLWAGCYRSDNPDWERVGEIPQN